MEMNIRKDVLKARRERNNWTQQHLAEMCGVSLRTIQRIEKTGIASNETVAALSSVFEIDREEFILQPEEVRRPNGALHEYRIAAYLLLGAQVIGLSGIFYSSAALTALQLQLAVSVVCGSTLLAFITLGVSAYRKGLLRRPQQQTTQKSRHPRLS